MHYTPYANGMSECYIYNTDRGVEPGVVKS